MIVLDGKQVREFLPMDRCIDAMAAAMQAASGGRFTTPPREMFPLQGGGIFAVMPGMGRELGVYGAKIASVTPGNSARGLPAIHGIVVLFDYDAGVPISVMDGAEITAIRTAAASGLATRLLAREDARTLGMLGTGVQAVTHLDAMVSVRPLQSVRVWGRDPASTQRFAQEQAARLRMEVVAVDEPAEAASCDIVCAVTASPTPIVEGRWVRPGAHVNLVGAHSLRAREADTELIRKSSVYVDLLSSTKSEGGDVMIPIEEGAVTLDHVVGEIGQLLAGDIPGRQDDGAITVYNSVGFVAQDLYAAASVLEAFRRAN
jgi:ornithine cyclodeaminase/alanine dehydrogenase-like protein (mu-crystallin family)